MFSDIVKMDTVEFIIKLSAIAVFLLIVVFSINRILKGIAKAVDEADIKKVGITGVEFDTSDTNTRVFSRKKKPVKKVVK